MHMFEFEDDEVVETQVDPAADTDTGKVADPAAGSGAGTAETRDFYAIAEAAVWNDEDVPSEDTLKSYTEESFKALPHEAKIALAGFIQRERARAAEVEQERTKIAAEREAALKEIADREADFKRRESAYSKAVADPATVQRLRAQVAARPTVINPNDQSSIEKAIDARAAEAVLQSLAPAIERHDQIARQNHTEVVFADAGLDVSKPEDKALVNAKIKELFGGDVEHVRALSAQAAAKGARSPLQVAVSVIKAERDAKATAEARRAETTDRLSGARAMSAGSARVTAEPTPEEIVAEVSKRIGDDPELFDREYTTNPKFRDAVNRQTGINFN